MSDRLKTCIIYPERSSPEREREMMTYKLSQRVGCLLPRLPEGDYSRRCDDGTVDGEGGEYWKAVSVMGRSRAD